jgi:acyl-CoA thioesterase FadM
VYPYLRLIRVLACANFKKKLHFDETSNIRLRVWPNDIDIYPEMNNGRHWTLMDLGRYDLAFRSGMIGVAMKNKWRFVVAGGSIRLRRRLPPFSRFILTSRLAGRDERWFYFVQETIRKGRVCSQAVIRAGIRDDKGLISAEKVVEKFNKSEKPYLEMPEWVKEWIKAEIKRPKI